MKKLNKVYIVSILFSIILLIFLISCGRKGNINEPDTPYIEITEYSGISKPEDVPDSIFSHTIGDSVDSNYGFYDSLFCQTIYWNAWDVDGVVKSFAYRIGTWDSVNSEWNYDKAYGIEIETTENYGWVLHEQPNGDSLIWTAPDERFPRATVYFPSTDTSDFKNNFGKFEVKCKDDQGNVSNTATKYFCTYSTIPSTRITTSQGSIDSCRVGAAINFKFTVNDSDLYGYGDEAWYYKYRIVKVPRIGGREDTLGKSSNNYSFAIGTEILYSSDWYSTKEFPDDPTSKDGPNRVFLASNYENDEYEKPLLTAGSVDELTQIQVKAVDKAGIEDPNYAKMTFLVRDYFKPETLPFIVSEDPNMPTSLGGNNANFNIVPELWLLGKNHFLEYRPTQMEIPTKVQPDGTIHYADKFYADFDLNPTAIWSDDIQLVMRWGYLGEYEYNTEAGKRFVGDTYSYESSRDDYTKYFCEVEYMEIQLDGGVESLPAIGEVISDNGEEWMRTPIENDQKCNIFELSPGEHTFMVRAVDEQGAKDPTPESFVFNLKEYVPKEDKEGILIINNTKEDENFAPDVISFYDSCLSNTNYNRILNRLNPYAPDSLLAVKKHNDFYRTRGTTSNCFYFSQSDISKYKLILWHFNDPSIAFNRDYLWNYYDILMHYIDNGGNLLITGTSKIYNNSVDKNKFFVDCAGFSENSIRIDKHNPGTNKFINFTNPSQWYENDIMNGATGTDNPDIDPYPDLNYNDNLPIYSLNLEGFGGVTFIDCGNATPIYSGLPKPSIQDPEDYEGCIGTKYKKSDESGTTYILGLPLLYIQQNDAKAFLQRVFDDVGIN